MHLNVFVIIDETKLFETPVLEQYIQILFQTLNYTKFTILITINVLKVLNNTSTETWAQTSSFKKRFSETICKSTLFVEILHRKTQGVEYLVFIVWKIKEK